LGLCSDTLIIASCAKEWQWLGTLLFAFIRWFDLYYLFRQHSLKSNNVNIIKIDITSLVGLSFLKLDQSDLTYILNTYFVFKFNDTYLFLFYLKIS